MLRCLYSIMSELAFHPTSFRESVGKKLSLMFQLGLLLERRLKINSQDSFLDIDLYDSHLLQLHDLLVALLIQLELLA